MIRVQLTVPYEHKFLQATFQSTVLIIVHVSTYNPVIKSFIFQTAAPGLDLIFAKEENIKKEFLLRHNAMLTTTQLIIFPQIFTGLGVTVLAHTPKY
jgi:hypothetical protein